MNLTAIPANGLDQAEATFQKAARRVTNDVESSDAVSLSDAAVSVLQSRNAVSADIQTLKVADQMEKEPIGLIR